MKKEIKLPRISEGEDTGVVSDVYVSKGDQVEEEQSIIAVESDKATVDVPVEISGKVAEGKVQKGDEISVGDTLIVLETNGSEAEQGAEGEEREKEEEGKAEKTKVKQEEEAQAKDARESEEPRDSGRAAQKKEEKGRDKKEDADTEKRQDDKPAEQEAKTDDREKVKKSDDEVEEEGDQQQKKESSEKEVSSKGVGAAPLARQFARELGIDLSELQGGDPDARVTREQVFEYARKIIRDRSRSRRQTEDGGFELPDFSRWGDTERDPMTQIRRATAKKTARSWKHIPHVTQFDKADITALEEFRKAKDATTEPKLTITSFLLKVCAEALIQYPKFNASLDMQRKEVVLKQYINIGVAVDTEKGLLMPVIRDVDKKAIPEIAGELLELGDKARNGKLTADDMDGGNFAISNQGSIGGNAFTPIIFPPQVAILGVSRAAVEATFNKGEFLPRTILPLCVSYDHRLIDGADAARFLRLICETLEEPMNLLMQ
jgi:pyruvate dehydrogenase E2 component (dihydrolipoamide acetyltransferase)